ncbi:MAG: hypothetical protein AAF420_10375 [Pseudomonadota bacterium]
MFSIIADSLARASGIESEHDARRVEARRAAWRTDAKPLPEIEVREKQTPKASSSRVTPVFEYNKGLI